MKSTGEPCSRLFSRWNLWNAANRQALPKKACGPAELSRLRKITAVHALISGLFETEAID
jgi:hypothetical protein